MENKDKSYGKNKQALGISTLSLFASFGTLICCALPALFVSLGAGAALASMLSIFPQLIWLSLYKKSLFAIAGLLLLFAASMQWHYRNAPCPAGPNKAKACMRLRKLNSYFLLCAALLYAIGFFFAFLFSLSESLYGNSRRAEPIFMMGEVQSASSALPGVNGRENLYKVLVFYNV